jgi:hypothetical protein
MLCHLSTGILRPILYQHFCAASSSPMQASLSRRRSRPSLLHRNLRRCSSADCRQAQTRPPTRAVRPPARSWWQNRKWLVSLEVASASRVPAVAYDHPIVPNWSTHCLMLPGSGGARRSGHLRENGRAIVRRLKSTDGAEVLRRMGRRYISQLWRRIGASSRAHRRSIGSRRHVQ